MDDSTFKITLYEAYGKKLQWFDTEMMKNLLEEYRNLHQVVQTLITILEKKSLIRADPYKLEKKIVDISVPESTPFVDSERAMVLGTRLSDFESTLDFVCNIFQFSINNLTVERIKNLLALNNFIAWNSLSPNDPRVNTKALASCIMSLKQGNEQISFDLAQNGVNQASKAIVNINTMLKEVSEFKKESFKMDIRQHILDNPGFSREKAEGNPDAAAAQIKKLFPSLMGKRPYFSEQVDELVREEFGPEKEKLREELLKKFQMSEKKQEKKTVTVNTKEMLMEAVRTLSGMSPQLETVIGKIQENNAILEDEKRTFMERLKAAFRKAFNLKEPPIEYRVTINDTLKAVSVIETINYNDFMKDLTRRSRVYAALAVKKAAGYVKLEAQDEKAIEEYLAKQLSECNRLMMLLAGLDDYFKNNTKPENRNRIKGLKMELTTMKNLTVKANQRKAEYNSYVEEVAQLKKLGITGE